MAIARPVTKTVISTTAFGIPVAEGLNAVSPKLIYGKLGMVGSLAVPSTAAAVTLQVNNFVGNGIGSSSTGFVIQTPGVYLVTCCLLFQSTANQPASGAIWLEGRVMVGATMAASQFMGPTGIYYALPLIGTVRVVAGDAVSIAISSNFTTTSTDPRGVITIQWMGA